MQAVRKIAEDSKNVAFGVHARERMEERGIDDRDAIKVIRIGELKGDIEPGKARGEWKCKITAQIKGSREIGVVTLVLATGKILVKTVEWEDP
jgi:hypothetical protein